MNNPNIPEDLIRFMQVAREDKSLKNWLLYLAKLPDNLRETELYEMEMRMRNSKETQLMRHATEL